MDYKDSKSENWLVSRIISDVCSLDASSTMLTIQSR